MNRTHRCTSLCNRYGGCPRQFPESFGAFPLVGAIVSRSRKRKLGLEETRAQAAALEQTRLWAEREEELYLPFMYTKDPAGE